MSGHIMRQKPTGKVLSKLMPSQVLAFYMVEIGQVTRRMTRILAIPLVPMVVFSAGNEKLCEKKQSYGITCKKHNAKHTMEKLCEKKNQRRSSMMPLSKRLEEIFWKSYM